MKIKNSESFNTEQCKDVREVWWACLGWAVSYCNWKTSTAERIVLPFFTIGKMRNFVFWTVVLAAVLKIWTVLSICFGSVALLLSGRMLGSRKWQIHNFCTSIMCWFVLWLPLWRKWVADLFQRCIRFGMWALHSALTVRLSFLSNIVLRWWIRWRSFQSN